MSDLYSKPLRVYILLGALALCGIWSGFQLPISLFPSGSQITISAYIPYGQLSSTQFYETYGRSLESSLQRLKVDGASVQEVRAEYNTSSADYRVQFEWGADPDEALKEVETKVLTDFANASDEVRRGIGVNNWRENQGFFALSFYSPMRSLDEIYNILNPLITPMSSRVLDAEGLGLYNPNQKEVTITVFPEKLAQYQVSTAQVQDAIRSAVQGMNGGSLKIGERDYQVNFPKSAESQDDLWNVRIVRKGAKAVFLKDIAKISVGLSQNSRQKFKTSGVESLILFASPKSGGNIKNMADQILSELAKIEHEWPKDIEYKVLVNPSEFINNSILGVIKEVFLAAFLAVLVLFCFIGSFKNVITAAIEIPLSLVMAFILMKLAGMNLNLISLGGLALSAGMNVDASVVVLENIFRHFEQAREKFKRTLSASEKLQTLVEAVHEVRAPIIASTIASLVVFMPLVFTKGLTNSLLGDLAKAVIFSHGLSAIVALVLVPTIRLQLLSRGNASLHDAHSPFEKALLKLESGYRNSLSWFLRSTSSQIIAICAIIVILPALIMGLLPRLDKEVIGRPDTDWLIIGVYSPTFTNQKQLESEVDALEQGIVKMFADKMAYTFTQLHGESNGEVMVRLKNKKDIQTLFPKAEDAFKNTATKFYFVEQWNPSELRIPDPPNVRVEVIGGSPERRLQLAQDLQNAVLEKGTYDKVRVTPEVQRKKGIVIRDLDRFGGQQEVLSKPDIAHYLRVATEGVYVDRLYQHQQEIPIYLRTEKDSIKTLEQISALPVGYESRLIPLGALAHFSMEDLLPSIYRENQRDLILLQGRLNTSNKSQTAQKKAEFEKTFSEFQKRLQTSADPETKPTLLNAVPDKELQEALTQLKWAIAISIFLIFITMILQLGDIVQSLLVLVAIPLGFVGVVISLWVFRSNLSLNSGLGTILLNGIAVANSIILVDFIQKLFQTGKSALESTVQASSARLRPILMTSLTTGLGMLPVALGLGDGGKILQPLGIAVCGGLWVSTFLTLFFVPALQFQYLKRKENKTRQTATPRRHEPELAQ